MKADIPSLVLHNIDDAFTDDEKRKLVELAKEREWVSLLKLSETEILEKYSTTPKFEPRWFADSIKESAEYVKKYEADICVTV